MPGSAGLFRQDLCKPSPPPPLTPPSLWTNPVWFSQMAQTAQTDLQQSVTETSCLLESFLVGTCYAPAAFWPTVSLTLRPVALLPARSRLCCPAIGCAYNGSGPPLIGSQLTGGGSFVIPWLRLLHFNLHKGQEVVTSERRINILPTSPTHLSETLAFTSEKILLLRPNTWP